MLTSLRLPIFTEYLEARKTSTACECIVDAGEVLTSCTDAKQLRGSRQEQCTMKQG